MSTSRFSGRVAVITGGSRGIGRTTVERFVSEGASVAILDVNVEAGDALAAYLREQGANVHFFAANVTDLAGMTAVASRVMETFGRVDILINNAGITRDASFKKMTEEAFDAVIAVNLKGVWNTTKAFLPYLEQSPFGRVINTASVVAHNGNFGQTNYVATKSGVIGLTKTLAREMGRKGITVNAVAPGFIRTEMIETVPKENIAQLESRTPLARLGLPEDIAAAYAFLASDDAAYITATCLNVDGGLVL
jgi:3-oxoacyl-[acyl-carrier protein] reductase